MTTNINPFEYTIMGFLSDNEKRKFTSNQIAKYTKMNPRTAKRWVESLVKKQMIGKINIGRKPLYFV